MTIGNTFLSSGDFSHSAPVQLFLVPSGPSIIPFYHKYPFNQLPQGILDAGFTSKISVKTKDIAIADEKIGNSWMFFYMPLPDIEVDVDQVSVYDQNGIEYFDHVLEGIYLKHGYRNSDSTIYFVRYDSTSERHRQKLVKELPLFDPRSPLKKVQFEETSTGFSAVLDKYKHYYYMYLREHVIDLRFQSNEISVKSSILKHANYPNIHYRVLEESVQFSYPNKERMPRLAKASIITPNVIKTDSEIDQDFPVVVTEYDVFGNFIREIEAENILSISGRYVHFKNSVNISNNATVSFFMEQRYYMVPVPTEQIKGDTMLVYIRPRHWTAWRESSDTEGLFEKIPHKLHYVIYDKTGLILHNSELLIKKDGTDLDVQTVPGPGVQQAEYIEETDLVIDYSIRSDFGEEYSGLNHLILAFVTNPSTSDFVINSPAQREPELDVKRLKQLHFMQYLAGISQPINGCGSVVAFHRSHTNVTNKEEFKGTGTKVIFYEL